jgi:hypothetical protein
VKRHSTDTVSLVFGLIFAAIIVWWAVAVLTNDSLHLPAAWVGVGTLIVIGIVGLATALPKRSRTTAPPVSPPPVDEDPDAWLTAGVAGLPSGPYPAGTDPGAPTGLPSTSYPDTPVWTSAPAFGTPEAPAEPDPTREPEFTRAPDVAAWPTPSVQPEAASPWIAAPQWTAEPQVAVQPGQGPDLFDEPATDVAKPLEPGDDAADGDGTAAADDVTPTGPADDVAETDRMDADRAENARPGQSRDPESEA